MTIKQYIIGLLMFLSMGMQAQQDLVLYTLPGVGQSIYLDPARRPHNGTHVGLPFMSSISVHHYNTFLNPGELLKQNEGQVEFQTDEFLDRLEDENLIGLDLSSDLFSFGMEIHGHYLSFGLRDRLHFELSLPGDLFRFPFYGNGDFERHGGVLDFSGMGVELMHYTEYGFGWQREVNDKLSLGARAKLLMGKENISTTKNDLQWITNTLDYSWAITGDMEIQTAGIQSLTDSIDGNALLENGRIGQYILGGPNKGFGFDLAANYQLNEKFDFGISVLDIGSINWKEDVKNYGEIGADVTLSAVEISESFFDENASFSDSLENAVQDIIDDLKDSFDPKETSRSYRTGLNTAVHIRAGYQLFERQKSNGRIHLLFRSGFDNGLKNQSITLGYVHQVVDRVALSFNYSSIGKDRKNIGLGFSVKGGPVVFYASMDNVLWLNMTQIRTEGSGSAASYPSQAKNSALHFGMNLQLGPKAKEKGRAARLNSSK